MISKVDLLRQYLGRPVIAGVFDGSVIVRFDILSKDTLTNVSAELIEVTTKHGRKNYFDVPLIVQIIT